MYYRIAELLEEKLIDRGRGTLDVYVRALKEFPLDEKTRRGGRAPRRLGRRRLGDARQRVRRRPRPAQRQGRAAHDRPAPREDVRGRARRHRQGRGDVPLRPRRRGARRRGARQPRSHLPSLEQWAELAQASSSSASGAPADDARAGRALRPPRRGLRGRASATSRRRDPRVPRDLRRLDKTHDAAIQALARIYAAQERVDGAQRASTSASSRTRRATSQEAEIRAKIAHLARRPPERSAPRDRHLEARPRSARRGSRGARRAREPLRAAAAVGASSSTSSSASTTSRRATTTRVERPHAPRAHLRRASSAATTSRSKTGTASSTSTTRTSTALRAIAAIWRRAERPAGARHRAPPDGRSRRGDARRRGAQGDLPRARQDLRRAALRSRTTRSTRGGSSSRSIRATSRRWPPSRAIYRAEEQWAEVIDVKMQRAAALEDPAEKIRGVPRGRRALGETGQEPDKATPAWQKILEIDADARRGVPRAREAPHRGRRAGSRSSSSISAASTRARRPPRRPTSSAGSRRSSRRSSTTRTRPSTRSSTRSARTSTIARPSKYLERMAQATGRWGELIQTVNSWLQAQTEPHQKIRLCLHLAKWYGEDLGHPEYAQPYYAQIVALDPNNVGVLRQMGQLLSRRTATGSSSARRSRARSTSPSPTSIARRSSPSSASCSTAR